MTPTREHVRLLALLLAAERAGLVPLDVRALHTFAFLANVLSPVWDLPAMDGKVLKSLGGPFYPKLQHDLDQLVGLGVATISNVGHERDESGRWRLIGAFRLHPERSAAAIEMLQGFDDEAEVIRFLTELGLALSGMSEIDVGAAFREDATYGDPVVGPGNVLDFSEWQDRNFSANAAARFAALMPIGVLASQEELLHLYIRHLRERLAS